MVATLCVDFELHIFEPCIIQKMSRQVPAGPRKIIARLGMRAHGPVDKKLRPENQSDEQQQTEQGQKQHERAYRCHCNRTARTPLLAR